MNPLSNEPLYSPQELRQALRLLGVVDDARLNEETLREPKTSERPWLASLQVLAALSLVSERVKKEMDDALAIDPTARSEFESERARISAK
jgi:hypothetical protein